MADEIRSRLTDYSDEQLAELVNQGDSEAFAELTVRYMSIVRARVSPFHADRVETEDLCQEGLLGLLRAAQTYDPKNRASFRTYAGVCISNRVIMAYRSAAAHKNDPLNNFVSLSEENAPDFASGDRSVNPETLITDREGFQSICDEISNILTPMENSVLRLYLGGCSYSEIAKKMSVTVKAADNALQRVRYKLKHIKQAP